MFSVSYSSFYPDKDGIWEFRRSPTQSSRLGHPCGLACPDLYGDNETSTDKASVNACSKTWRVFSSFFFFRNIQLSFLHKQISSPSSISTMTSTTWSAKYSFENTDLMCIPFRCFSSFFPAMWADIAVTESTTARQVRAFASSSVGITAIVTCKHVGRVLFISKPLLFAQQKVSCQVRVRT